MSWKANRFWLTTARPTVIWLLGRYDANRHRTQTIKRRSFYHQLAGSVGVRIVSIEKVTVLIAG
jgi:hypothetical protein